MKVIIASYNLIADKSHLMPWRYVCEIANYFNQNGHQATIVSIGNTTGSFELEKGRLLVREVRKSNAFLYKDISALIKEYSIDMIFWPVSWREKKSRLHALKKTEKPVISYFPGGMYTIKDVLYAVRRIGLRPAIPYILEAISPKRRQLGRFKSNGIKEIITLTDWTAECIKNYGWPMNNVTVALPGKEDSKHDDVNVIPAAVNQWLGGARYLVFMGPPTPIRGGYELLRAFDRVVDIDDTIRLVCLFRSDVGVDQSEMKAFVESLNNSSSVYTIWESLERQQLEAFISNSFAIALPFIVVPSEIPLAIIDAASYGKPVVTTKCGGTGEFVKEYGVTVDVSDVTDFRDKILNLIRDESFYLDRCKNARLVYERHPTWSDMSKSWLDIAQKIMDS